MKRRLAMLMVSFSLAGLFQVAAAPAASACADPNCPWSPVTDYARRVIGEVDRICDENTTFGCPL